MAAVYPLIEAIGIASLALAPVYSLLALVAVLVSCTRRKPRARPQPPPVTLLKPLCGIEPGLYEHLRSFCEQAYPRYQIVFGVSDGKDPALPIAIQLKREYPDLRIDVVVDPKQHGHNRKISSLINMMKVAPTTSPMTTSWGNWSDAEETDLGVSAS
jgi:ceramide glucosyltransferase